MNLDLFNNLLNNAKENNFVQNFIEELSNFLEKGKNKMKENSLKQEDGLYQVVEIDTDGAYLQNVEDNKIYKETDIDILDKIENDTVLRYKDGKYIIEEELTQKFLDSLIGIKEYREIQDKFVQESNILELESNTQFKIEKKEEDSSILSYGENMIEVPNELIPFWSNIGDKLYFQNGKFSKDM